MRSGKREKPKEPFYALPKMGKGRFAETLNTPQQD
jgi:hypothetical protein